MYERNANYFHCDSEFLNNFSKDKIWIMYFQAYILWQHILK